MTTARRRDEQRDATKALLLDAARDLFTRYGFDGTSVAMVCERAGVTHGALYHHFDGKLGLFDDTLQAVTGSVAEAIASRISAATGWDRLCAAIEAFLDQYSRPEVATIVLSDGPRVVGRDRFAEIDRAANEPLLTGLLNSAIDDNVLRPVTVSLTARVFAGSLEQAAAVIAETDNGDRDRVRGELRSLLLSWLAALRHPPGIDDTRASRSARRE